MGRVIKILYLAANPKDTSQLRLDEEVRGIDQALRQAEFRDKFEIQQQWATRVTDIQSYLLRYKPDIVHFSGHGSTSSEIILEDNSGKSQSVSSRSLSQLFSILKDNIRCVVLNACYSEQQAQGIAKHIDCVIGMSKSIGDRAAISFAAAFYQALGFGRDVKTSFELGCLQIDLERLNEQDTPKLLCFKFDPKSIVFVDKSITENEFNTNTGLDIKSFIKDTDEALTYIKPYSQKGIDRAIEFITQNISEYFANTLATIKNPVVRFQPLDEFTDVKRSTIRNLRMVLDSTDLRLNPKLLAFVIISIILGITINTLIPNRKSSPDFLTSLIVIIVFWILSSTLVHLLCKILRGTGSYLETISVSLQVFSALYVISSALALAFSAIIEIQYISTSISEMGNYAKWIAKNPIYSFYITSTLLYAIYLPLALHNVHHFNWLRQIIISLLTFVLSLFGTIFGITIYKTVGILARYGVKR